MMLNHSILGGRKAISFQYLLLKNRTTTTKLIPRVLISTINNSSCGNSGSTISSIIKSSNNHHINTTGCKFYSSSTTTTTIKSEKEDDDFLDDNIIEGYIVEYLDKSSGNIKLGLLDETLIYQENFTSIKAKDVTIIEKWSNMLTTLNDLREIKEKANYMVLDDTYQADFEVRLENLLIEGFTSGKKYSSSTLSNELFEMQNMITRYIACYLFENSGCFKYDPRSNKYIVIETDSSQMRVKDFIRRAKKRMTEINELKQKNGQIENNSHLLNSNLHTKWDPIIDVPMLRKMEFFILSNFLNAKNKIIIESILESFGFPKNRRGAAQFLHAVGHMHVEKSSNFMEGEVDFENVKNLPSILKPFPQQVESASQIMLKQVTSIIEREKQNTSVRRDLRKLKCVAIDDISTQAYDDAISIEKTVNGYKVYIHTCDISSFITKNDAIEKESRSRIKTIYGKNGVRLMLHPCAIRAVTLSPERENLAFTLELNLIKSGSELKLDKYEFYKSILPKVDIFTYNTVDSLFNQYVKKRIGNKATSDMDQSHQLLVEMLDISVNIDKSLNLGLIAKTKSTPAHDTVAIIMSIANSVLAAHIKQAEIQHLFPQSNSYYRFTSPMRRYSDMVTHIQYNSLLGTTTTTTNEEEQQPIVSAAYSEKEIKNLCTEIQLFEKDILETQLMMDKKKRELVKNKHSVTNNNNNNNNLQKQTNSNKVVGQVVKKRKGMSSVYIPSMDKTISIHLVEYDEVKMIELLSGILPETEKSSMDMLGWPAITKKMKENRSPNDITEGSKVVLNVKHIEYYENDSYKPKVIVAEHCFEEKVDNYTL